MKYELDSIRKKILGEKTLQIRNALEKVDSSEFEIALAVVDVIFVLEQVLKIKIAEENILLVYTELPKDVNLKDVLEHASVANLHTVRIIPALERFKILFPESDITKNSQSAVLLSSYRNEIYHHVVPIQETESLASLVQNLFGAMLGELEGIIGPMAKLSGVKRELTKEEVAELFEDSIRRKLALGNHTRDLFMPYDGLSGTDSIYGFPSMCPRCRRRSFAESRQQSIFVYQGGAGEPYYQCSNCHLELTTEEYEVAKKILMSEG